MGAWSVNFLDNDTALDFVCHWEKFVVPCIEINCWNEKTVWEFYRDIYFKNRFNILDSEQNCEVLALGTLFQKYDLVIPEELRSILEKSINAELRRSALDEWAEPSIRKKILTKFLKDEGLEKKKLLKSEMVNIDLKAEIDKILPFSNKMKKMVSAVCPPSADDDFEKNYPEFFDEVDKILINGIPLPIVYTDQEMRLIKLRLKLLTFYCGWKLRLPAKDILELIKSAKSTEGYIHFNAEVFGRI